KEQQQTARAQREASALQMAVKSYVESIVKSVNPRSITFDHSRFDRIVKRLPAGRAEILYEPNDPEARDFASLIHGALSGAGWSVGNSIQPAGAAGGASTGLGVRARNRYDAPTNEDEAIPIREMLTKAITGREDIPDWTAPIHALPDHIFTIVVGH